MSNSLISFSGSTQDSFYTHSARPSFSTIQPFTPLPELELGATDLSVPEPLPNGSRIVGLAF